MKWIVLLAILIPLKIMDSAPDTPYLYDWLDATNNEREEALSWSNCLAEQAEKRAKELYDRNYFSHSDPITGKPIWQDYAYKCGGTHIGENLAKNFNNIQDMNKALMGSPLHKRNIQNKDYKEVGLACYNNICVQLFSN